MTVDIMYVDKLEKEIDRLSRENEKLINGTEAADILIKNKEEEIETLKKQIKIIKGKNDKKKNLKEFLSSDLFGSIMIFMPFVVLGIIICLI